MGKEEVEFDSVVELCEKEEVVGKGKNEESDTFSDN
jgi:hypothetical protein